MTVDMTAGPFWASGVTQVVAIDAAHIASGVAAVYPMSHYSLQRQRYRDYHERV